MKRDRWRIEMREKRSNLKPKALLAFIRLSVYVCAIFFLLCALYFMFAVFPCVSTSSLPWIWLELKCIISLFFLCVFASLYFTVPQFFGYYCFFALLLLAFCLNAQHNGREWFQYFFSSFFVVVVFVFVYKMLCFLSSFCSVVTYYLFYVSHKKPHTFRPSSIANCCC